MMYRVQPQLKINNYLGIADQDGVANIEDWVKQHEGKPSACIAKP